MNNNQIIDRIIEHLRTQFMEHQEELKSRSPEDTIALDNMIEDYIIEWEQVKRIEDGNHKLKAIKCIYDKYDNKYGPKEVGYMEQISDSIVLSEQNIDEIMSLEREALSIFRLEERRSLSAAQFLEDGLIKLKKYLQLQPDSFEKSEKIAQIEKYLSYLGMSMGQVGVEGSVMCDIGEGATFRMSKCAGIMEDIEPLLSIENGCITIDTLQKRPTDKAVGYEHDDDDER